MDRPPLPFSNVLSALREGVRRLLGRQRPARDVDHEQVTEGTPAPTAVGDEELEALVELVRDRFGQLSPETRDDIVRTVAAVLDGDAPIEQGQDVLDALEDRVRAAGRGETVDAIVALREHAPTVTNLRGRYRRAPRLTRGAIEKTAAAALRTGGVRRQTAGGTVRTLLTMPPDDWRLLLDTLDEVDARFVGDDP